MSWKWFKHVILVSSLFPKEERTDFGFSGRKWVFVGDRLLKFGRVDDRYEFLNDSSLDRLPLSHREYVLYLFGLSSVSDAQTRFWMRERSVPFFVRLSFLLRFLDCWYVVAFSPSLVVRSVVSLFAFLSNWLLKSPAIDWCWNLSPELGPWSFSYYWLRELVWLLRDFGNALLNVCLNVLEELLISMKWLLPPDLFKLLLIQLSTIDCISYIPIY